MKDNRIPMLKEIFREIDKGKFFMEDDEVVSYYYDIHDQKKDRKCVSTMHQLLELYSIKDQLIGKD